MTCFDERQNISLGLFYQELAFVEREASEQIIDYANLYADSVMADINIPLAVSHYWIKI